MKQKDFTTLISVEAGSQQVFDAINNVRGWWSENIEGSTLRLNDVFSYHYLDVHRCKLKIVEIETGKKVRWQVLDNYFKFTEDKSEWKNTSIVFDIEETNGKTQLTFTHQGLVPDYECYQVCHDAWTHYIQESLKMLILTGKGMPTPKEDSSSATIKDGQQQSQPVAKSIYHRLLIEAPVEKVFLALTTQEGLAGWWTPDTLAEPAVGAVLRFGFGPGYFKQMEVSELTAYSKVRWQCIKAFEDWIGTTLTFELEPHQKGCILLFHHDGWKAYTPEFASCSFDWALFFRSLKLLCETGKGLPYPDFNK